MDLFKELTSLSLPSHADMLAGIGPARRKWALRPEEVVPHPIGPDEESVWNYPRPPTLEPSSKTVRVIYAGQEIATSSRAIRVLETAGAPVYYLPPEDVDLRTLHLQEGYTICEWKGAAIYFDIRIGSQHSKQAAFSYPCPLDDLGQGYSEIAQWIGFYPGRVEACYLDDEKVAPQEGDIYAGWVTRAIKGPIKGAPGTSHW